MPNRVIKESIKRSPQIDSLTWFEEVVFYRLIITADDYGCIDGRPVLIKNELFPTRENVTRKSVEDAIVKLIAVGFLFQYEVDGRPYLVFPTWEKHQRIRNKHRKYPAPPDEIYLTANCCQMLASCTPESESERESESNPNPKENMRVPRASFKPPTVGEVEEYCQERGNSVNAANFVDFYASKGWKIGNSPMKDWRAAVRTWERRESEQQGKSAPSGANRFANLERLYKQFGGEP